MAKAITYTEFGGPEVLRLTDVEVPTPGPGQVRISVRATSVNPVDMKIRRGEMAAVFPAHFPIAPGLDAAGIVDGLGEGVSGVAVGDEVLGLATAGSYAEYALLHGPVAKPAGLSWEIAASLPTVGEAAFRGLKHLDLAPGETLLIHGAAGSVGSIATQLAVARGITVIGSVGPSDQEMVRALGAIPVVYGEGLIERVRAIAPQGVDAVLDTAGHGVLPDSIALTGGPERVITLADMGAGQYGVRFSGADPSDRAPEALAQLVELAVSGQLNLPIWRTYPLAGAAQAQAAIEAGEAHGKVVLLP